MIMAALVFVAQIACTPTAIIQSEAKALAIQVGESEANKLATVDAELSEPTDLSNYWTFRVFATNSRSFSDQWVSVDKRTVALSDPISMSALSVSKDVERAQNRLKKIHCLL